MKKFLLLVALMFPVGLSAQATVDTVDVPALDTILTREGVETSARTVTSTGANSETPVTWAWKSNDTLFSSIRPRGESSDTAIFFAQSDTGRAYLIATAGAKKDSTLYIVRYRCTMAVDSIDVALDSMRLTHPSMTFVSAQTFANCHQTLVDSAVTWSSTETDTATVQTNGRVNTVGAGETYIKAVRGSGADSVLLTVE